MATTTTQTSPMLLEEREMVRILTSSSTDERKKRIVDATEWCSTRKWAAHMKAALKELGVTVVYKKTDKAASKPSPTPLDDDKTDKPPTTPNDDDKTDKTADKPPTTPADDGEESLAELTEIFDKCLGDSDSELELYKKHPGDDDMLAQEAVEEAAKEAAD